MALVLSPTWYNSFRLAFSKDASESGTNPSTPKASYEKHLVTKEESTTIGDRFEEVLKEKK